jgi:hypothetical protein
MKKWIKIAGGVLLMGFGGLWCLGLLIARVDPPEVARVNGVIAIAAGILALGVNLFGKGILSNSKREAEWSFRVFGLSFAVWLLVSIGLVSWHQFILHVRKTRAHEAMERIEQQMLEQPDGEPTQEAARSATP